MSTKQVLLDAIDRAQEALDDIHQHANNVTNADDESVKRKRANDKAYINVARLEQYMPLCDYLAVGHRPMNAKQFETLIQDNNIQYIINLRPKDGDKGLWYTSLAKQHRVQEIIHIPLENSEDKDRTRIDDQKISSVASRVVAYMRQLDESVQKSQSTQVHMHLGRSLPTVYLHGYGNAHVAMVIGMVAWYMYRDDNRFDPLQALVDRYDESIASHYPEHWFHRQQVTRICDMERRSVYAALKRAKVNVTRGARSKNKRKVPGKSILDVLTKGNKK